MSTCKHFDEAQPVPPHKEAHAGGCPDCLAVHGSWVHLRQCLLCGHVGCCDSSPHKHATAHFHTSHHAIMRSVEPGETWGWCYRDGIMAELG